MRHVLALVALGVLGRSEVSMSWSKISNGRNVLGPGSVGIRSHSIFDANLDPKPESCTKSFPLVEDISEIRILVICPLSTMGPKTYIFRGCYGK